MKLPLSMMSEKSLMTSFPERLLKCEINICPYKISFPIVYAERSRRYAAGATPVQKWMVIEDRMEICVRVAFFRLKDGILHGAFTNL